MPESCAIQNSDRWGRLIRFLSNFWGSFQWPSGGSLFTFWKNKRKSTKHFCLVLFVVHLQGLEPWAHWLREQAAGSSQFLEVSSHCYFWTRQRDFLPSNFCTLCRILQRKAPFARFETVQNPCRNRALTLWQTKSPYSLPAWRHWFEWPTQIS